MAELRFAFPEMIDEVEAFSRLADEFIDKSSRHVLPWFKSALESYRDQARHAGFLWQIPSSDPLRTIVSNGEYESGAKRGHHDLVAEIDACWEIQRIPGKKKHAPAAHFKVTGIASTRIRLFSENENSRAELGMWRMEIGDTGSPGCHFHVQILGENAAPPFPNSLCVPRLPGLILTPTAVVEFVLERLNNLLQWNLRILELGGSPWTTIKQQKPEVDLFL